jgi:hypothetical protein
VSVEHWASARHSRSSAAALARFLTSTEARRRAVARAARRYVLVLWWLLTAMLLAVLVVVTRPRTAETVRLGPAEDDPAERAIAVELAPRIHLAPAEEGPPAPDLGDPPGLSVATGGPPLPLRAGPDRSASVLVQVPDGASLEDLLESTPDGAWRRVGWNGWEGWIAAGVLRRRP